MSLFGNFETARELFRTPLGGIWTCRPIKSAAKGFPKAEYAVKVLMPDAAAILDDTSLHQQINFFLERARLQERMSGSPHWAPVHEVGTVTGGAYFVTEYCESSAHRLMNGRVQTTSAKLQGLAGGVLDGLLELKQTCQCSHGNLRPTNVLISDRGDPGGSRILLCDPVPSGSASGAGGEAADLRSLGELVTRLVLKRPASTGSPLPAWPITDSSHWQELGKGGEQWREFCNFLLDPYSSAASRNLEQARRHLELFDPVPKAASPRRRQIMVGAAVLVVGLIGTAVGYKALSPRAAVGPPVPVAATVTIDPDRKAREMLAAKMNQEAWAASLSPAVRVLARVATDDPSLLAADVGRIEGLAGSLKSLQFSSQVVPGDLPPLRNPVTEAAAATWLHDVQGYAQPQETDPRVAAWPNWKLERQKLKEKISSKSTPAVVRAAAAELDATLDATELKAPWTVKDRAQILGRIAEANQRVVKFEDALRLPPPIVPPTSAEIAANFVNTERLHKDLPEPNEPSALPAILAAWRSRRETVLHQIEQNPDQLTVLSAQVPRLRVAFRRLNAALRADPALPSNDPQPWHAEFEKAATHGRELRLADVLHSLPPEGTSAAAVKLLDDYCSQQAEDYKKWCERVAMIRIGLGHLNDGLRACYLPDETPPGSDRSVRQWLADCRPQGSAGPAPWDSILDDADARIRQLDGLGQHKPTALAAAIPGAEPVVVLAAWRQLGKLADLWPATLTDLQSELTIEQTLADTVLPLRTDLKAELDAARRLRWDNHLRLAARAGAASIQETCGWIAKNADRLAVKPQDMPAWFRFDLLLYRYKNDKALRTEYARLRAEAKTLPPSPAVSGFFTSFDQRNKPWAPLISPERAPVPLGFPRPLGDAISYTALDGRVKLTFIRVQPRDTGVPPFYLSTTEVSIGVFGNVIAQGTPGRYYNQVKVLLPHADSPDRWVGPHGWEMDGDRRVIIPRQNRWCDDYQFKNGQRPLPRPDHPMQYVTPEAALYLARLIGCRLPTAAEWREAYELSAQRATSNPAEYGWTTIGWKLRDGLWDEERNQSAAIAAIRWLDDGVFNVSEQTLGTHARAESWATAGWVERLQKEHATTITGIPEAIRQKGGRTNALIQNNTVLFRETSYNFNQSFHDLVGNVAEFVLDPESAIRAEAELPPEDAGKVTAFFQNSGTRVFVIGGSALSPPELGFDQPLPVSDERAKDGFTDVGFRLAFTDPKYGPQPHLDLATAEYLTGEPAPLGGPAPIVGR
jgi:formylglycine-generating enzyme required for sulfatase activity